MPLMIVRLLAALLVLAAVACAQEAPPPPQEDAARLCVRRLGSDDPEVREEAFRSLRKMRRKAIPALQEGAGSPDAEVAASCGQILQALESSRMTMEGGALAAGTPWWQARARKVRVHFQETPLSEIMESCEEDLGFRLRVTGLQDLAARRVTLHLDDAPLEFLLYWLLYASVDKNATGTPRLGWGPKDAVLSTEQRPGGDRIAVELPLDSALKGIEDADVSALAAFLEELGHLDGSPQSVKRSEQGLSVSAGPALQVDASVIADNLRRAANGEPALGAEVDAAAAEAGAKLVKVRWNQVPYEDAMRELSDLTGGRFGIDHRVSQWGGMGAWHQSNAPEPARDVLRHVAESMGIARVEQRWGGWWIFVDPSPQTARMLTLRSARAFVHDAMMADGQWKPDVLEGWVKRHLSGNEWGGSQNAAVQWFPKTGLVALYGPRHADETLASLLDGRARDTEYRKALLAGGAAEVPARTPAAVEDRLLARYAKSKVTKEFTSESFQENQVFQDLFNVLHDALDVNSTSGSMGSSPRNRIRACRLREVSTRVLWRWLNDSGIPYFLQYFPERRSASYGIGMARPWDGNLTPSYFNRARLHPSWEPAFTDLLARWDKDAHKEFRDAPSVPVLTPGGAVRLPRPRSERFFAFLGLDGSDAARPAAAPAAPEGLEKAIQWPGGAFTLEGSLEKLSELSGLNWVLDVPRNAKATRKNETAAGERKPRDLLDELARGADAQWSVGEEGVIWVASKGGDGKTWVFLEGGVSLGAAEADAVAKEFAKTGDDLVCFAPTGRFLARCASASAPAAQTAFEKARAAAREAALEEAAGLVEKVKAGEDAPYTLAGALALEKASEGSPALSLELARRVFDGGHFRDALGRARAIADSANDPALVARARALAASAATKFGAARPELDRDAHALARAVADDPAAPREALAEALLARAEVRRRAGLLDEAIEDYRRLAENGAETEDSRRWLSRLEDLK
jgi:tetratricopeptide (TPR) repeat protein